MAWVSLSARSVLGGARNHCFPVVSTSSLGSVHRAAKKKKGGGKAADPLQLLIDEAAKFPRQERILTIFEKPDEDFPTKDEDFPDWIYTDIEEYAKESFATLTPSDKRYYKMIRRKKIKDANMKKLMGIR